MNKKYKIYNLKNYKKPKNKVNNDYDENCEVLEGDLKEVCEELKKNKGYNMRLRDIDNVILFGDLDGYKKDIKDFLEEFKFFLGKMGIEVNNEDFYYTENYGYDKEGRSYHYSVPKYYGGIKNIKKLINKFKEENNYSTEIDISIYCDRWWRMPNQKKNNKKNTEHVIQKGEIKDFLVTYINEESICIDDIIESNEESTINLYENKRRIKKEIDNISELSDITETNNDNRIELDLFNKYLEGLSEKRSNEYLYWTHVIWIIYNVSKVNKWSLKVRNELIHNFSKRSSKYNECETDNFIENNIKENGILGVGTLILWYKEDNKELNNHKKLLNELLKNNLRDYDIAKYIENKLGNVFVCSDVRNEIWYRYDNHKWVEDDGGYTLLKKISEEITEDVINLLKNLRKQLINEKNDEIKEIIMNEINQCERLIDKCKNNSSKKNIYKELKYLYKKEKFMDNLDVNPYLLCCNNGVLDFKKKIFRKGCPEDMCSLSTGYDYMSLDEIKSDKEWLLKYEKLNNFFDEVFVIEGIRDYVYEHLSSTLIGICKEQDFNYYIGKGSNAKTMLVKLMSLLLGDYYGVAPTSLICSKKIDLGGCSSEIALLRGKRYVVMQEPTKGESINEGVMKELTGENEIYCNPKFKSPFFFTPMFHLIICANFTLDIKSNDDGTWRRIKIVEFLSKFKDNPDKEELFEFVKDINLIDNFKDWKKILLAILTEKAFILQGRVNDNIYIKNASLKYREEQDRIGQYIKECLKITNDKNTKENYDELYNSFKEWYEKKYNNKVGIKILLDRLEDEYNIKINNKKIYGISILNISDELIEKSDEDIFIEEFQKDFEITNNDLDFIKSIRLSEWSKIKKLNIYTSKSINQILNTKLNYNTKINLHKKSINGSKLWIFLGIKDKII